jgi:hypothetical protein
VGTANQRKRSYKYRWNGKLRHLPLIEADGNYAEWMPLIGYCYLLFPENEQDALRSLEVLVSENEAMQSGLQDGYGEIGVAVKRLLTRRTQRARNSGLFFLQLIMNMQTRGEPLVMQAEFAVAELLASTKTDMGKSIAVSGNNLRKRSFPLFKSAAHYWAAFQLLPLQDQLDCFTEIDSFHRLMMAATELHRMATEFSLPQSVELLKDWNPWLAPQNYTDLIAEGSIKVVIPNEPTEITRILGEYSHKPYESQW